MKKIVLFVLLFLIFTPIVSCNDSSNTAVEDVRLDKSSMTIDVGSTKQLTETILPTNATNKTVVWSSSDKSVATVSDRGVVTALSEGYALIRVTTTDGHFTDKCPVEALHVSAESVHLNKSSAVVPKRSTEQLIATILPANATNKELLWSSSDEKIVRISSRGVIIGVQTGSATIKVTTIDGRFTDRCDVTVPPVAVENVQLNKSSTIIDTGHKKQLVATISPIDAANKEVSWSSSDKNIASVDSNGVISAKSDGSVIITVTTKDGNLTDTCEVKITTPVYGVTLSDSELTLHRDETKQLTATISPSDATDQRVTWSSDNKGIATVSNTGLLTAISNGHAIIRVTTKDGGKTTTLALKVADDFITTWTTTSEEEYITIPTTGSGYNYTVEWGDGTADTEETGDAVHLYRIPGTYTVRIRGKFPRIYFNNAEYSNKIKTIESWGAVTWESMENAFAGCLNLTSNAIDAPTLSHVTDMSCMFCGAAAFNNNIGSWDVSHVTNMEKMFQNASAFNGDVSDWNVANVTNMRDMFHGASSFNQRIDAWNVSQVTDMSGMFFDASTFNKSINDWDVSRVTDMNDMFRGALHFNQNLLSWNVSNVTNMAGMFYGAYYFNQKLGGWNVASVTNMAEMFGKAHLFDGDIGDWNVVSVTNMSRIFYNARNFNQDIHSWTVSSVTDMSGMFSGASAFNQDVGPWDVSHVTNMDKMFYNATVFNQDIGYWDVSSATSMSKMLYGATAFTAQDLSWWDVSNVTDHTDFMIGSGSDNIEPNWP